MKFEKHEKYTTLRIGRVWVVDWIHFEKNLFFIGFYFIESPSMSASNLPREYWLYIHWFPCLFTKIIILGKNP